MGIMGKHCSLLLLLYFLSAGAKPSHRFYRNSEDPPINDEAGLKDLLPPPEEVKPSKRSDDNVINDEANIQGLLPPPEMVEPSKRSGDKVVNDQANSNGLLPPPDQVKTKSKRSIGKREVPLKGDVSSCFLCDAKCVNALRSKASAWKFFSDLVNDATKGFPANGIDVTLTLHNVFFEDKNIELTTLRSGKYDTISNILYNLYEKSGRWKEYKSKGCEMAFLVTPDRFFDAISLGGSAMAGGMCMKSYGYLKYTKYNFQLMSSKFKHEVGHLLGMQHYKSNPYPQYRSPPFDKYAADIINFCKGSVTSCSDNTGDCVMNNVQKAHNVPQLFTDCSRAYFKFWSQLPTPWYDQSCIRNGKQPPMSTGPPVEADTGSGSGEEE